MFNIQCTSTSITPNLSSNIFLIPCKFSLCMPLIFTNVKFLPLSRIKSKPSSSICLKHFPCAHNCNDPWRCRLLCQHFWEFLRISAVYDLPIAVSMHSNLRARAFWLSPFVVVESDASFAMLPLGLTKIQHPKWTENHELDDEMRKEFLGDWSLCKKILVQCE